MSKVKRLLKVWKIQTQDTEQGTTRFALVGNEDKSIKLTVIGDQMALLGLETVGDSCEVTFKATSQTKLKPEKD